MVVRLATPGLGASVARLRALAPKESLVSTTSILKKGACSVVAAVSLATPAAVVGAVALPSPASAAPTYTTTDDIGRRLLPVARPDGNYGVPRGTAFSPECQVIGEPHGAYGNTLYFRIFSPRHNTRIFLPDAWTNSPHLAGQPPIAGIPMCNSSAPVAPVAPVAPSGRGNFANAAVADYMLARVGRWAGQCRNAVNNAVYAVSGGKTVVGGYAHDYNQAFRVAGAYQVPNWQSARKGDIVQVGSTESNPRLHTYVVVTNYGNGRFRVVDSNHAYDEVMRTYDRSFDHNGGAAHSTIWRTGRV